MRLLLFSSVVLFALAGTARAQTDFVSEAAVDQETYGYGEPITLHFMLHNRGSHTWTIWAPSGCDPSLQFESLETPGESGGCSLMEIPFTMEAGTSTTWKWTLDPALLGVPEVDGLQTIRVRLAGACGPGGPGDSSSRSTHCSHADSVSFEAPQFLGGVLSVSYAPSNSDSAATLRRAYDGAVMESREFPWGISERWQIEGAPLLDAVAALDSSSVIESVRPHRALGYHSVFKTAESPGPAAAWVTPPTPNPTAASARFTVRLAQSEAVVVDLVDLLGRRTTVLHDGPLTAGVDHTFTLPTSSLPSGVYVLRVTGETVRQSRRVTVAR